MSNESSEAAATVILVCDSPDHARGKVAKIATYELRRYVEGEEFWEWVPSSKVHASDPDPALQELNGNTPLPRGTMFSDIPVGDRGRWAFTCPLCGFRVEGRDDVQILSKVFDRLSEHGVTTFPLRRLAAIEWSKI